MKTIMTSMILGAFLSLSPTLSMAGDCSCSKQCQSDCAAGNGKNCKCKECDCAKTGKCKHGECDTKKKDKPAS